MPAGRPTSHLPSFPERRFTVSRLTLKSDLIRIYLIDIGGHLYVRNLTDPTEDHGQIPTDVHSKGLGIAARLPTFCFGLWRQITSTFNSHTAEKSGVMSLDHKLNGSQYLAMKSDGAGVVDVAFTETEDGPEWLFKTQIASTEYGLSRVRYANVQDLFIISDVWTFSSFTADTVRYTNTDISLGSGEPSRHLAESEQSPISMESRPPPDRSWVDAGFRLKSPLTDCEFMDPSAYFTRAEYIQFATLASITLESRHFHLLTNIQASVPSNDEGDSVTLHSLNHQGD